MLAAKAALAIRVDALGEGTGCELGEEHKAKLMMRMQQLEDKSVSTLHLSDTVAYKQILVNCFTVAWKCCSFIVLDVFSYFVAWCCQ